MDSVVWLFLGIFLIFSEKLFFRIVRESRLRRKLHGKQGKPIRKSSLEKILGRLALENSFKFMEN